MALIIRNPNKFVLVITYYLYVPMACPHFKEVRNDQWKG